MTFLLLLLALTSAKPPYAKLPRKPHAKQLAMGAKLALRIDMHPQEITFTGPGELQYSAERRSDAQVHVLVNEPGTLQETIDLWSESAAAGAVTVGEGPHTVIVAADQESKGSVTFTLVLPGTALPAAVRANESVTMPVKKKVAGPPGDLSPKTHTVAQLLSDHSVNVWPLSAAHPLHFSITRFSALRLYLYAPLEGEPTRVVINVDGHPMMSTVITPLIAFDHYDTGLAVAAPDDYPLDLPPHGKELVLTSDGPVSVRLSSEP